MKKRKFNVTIYVPSVQIYTGTIEADTEEEASHKALDGEWFEDSDSYTVEDDYEHDDEVEIIVENLDDQD